MTEIKPAPAADDSDPMMSMDFGHMTEEEARAIGLTFLELELSREKQEMAGSIAFSVVFGLIIMLIFHDFDMDDDMFGNYFHVKKLVKQFRKDTYKGSYRAFMQEWQDWKIGVRDRSIKAEERREVRRKN